MGTPDRIRGIVDILKSYAERGDHFTVVFSAFGGVTDALINMSSLAGKEAFEGGSAYNASKFGLNGFSEALMLDLRYENIKVSYVLPGSVYTAFAGGDLESRPGNWKLAPGDVAQVVVDILQQDQRSLTSRVELRPLKPPRKT